MILYTVMQSVVNKPIMLGAHFFLLHAQTVALPDYYHNRGVLYNLA
jgi:hypothetical protein